MKLAKMKPGYLVVPYVGAFPDALLKHLRGLHSPFRIACERVDENNDHAYYDVLRHWWTQAGKDEVDLLIIEHDVYPSQEAIDGIVACRDVYCACPYWIGASHRIGLGCTRFRWQLMVENELLVESAAIRDDGLGPPGTWRKMDARIEAELAERKYLPCKHSVVQHRHPYPLRDPIDWEADA